MHALKALVGWNMCHKCCSPCCSLRSHCRLYQGCAGIPRSRADAKASVTFHNPHQNTIDRHIAMDPFQPQGPAVNTPHLIIGLTGYLCLKEATISAAPRLLFQLNSAALSSSSSSRDIPAPSRHNLSSASSRASAAGDKDTARSYLHSKHHEQTSSSLHIKRSCVTAFAQTALRPLLSVE